MKFNTKEEVHRILKSIGAKIQGGQFEMQSTFNLNFYRTGRKQHFYGGGLESSIFTPTV